MTNFGLSEREQEVMDQVILGLTNKEIGRKLFLSASTVKTHVSHVLLKTGCQNRTQAATWWLSNKGGS